MFNTGTTVLKPTSQTLFLRLSETGPKHVKLVQKSRVHPDNPPVEEALREIPWTLRDYLAGGLPILYPPSPGQYARHPPRFPRHYVGARNS
jgi:hypothetical protein